mmetsp:Transcript_1715/g.5145  ORF Transcript_1715/g.5145 Transcript_1715/m.5145 type:complete len:213 (+) Transcript_1715:803-1441(+)
MTWGSPGTVSGGMCVPERSCSRALKRPTRASRKRLASDRANLSRACDRVEARRSGSSSSSAALPRPPLPCDGGMPGPTCESPVGSPTSPSAETAPDGVSLSPSFLKRSISSTSRSRMLREMRSPTTDRRRGGEILAIFLVPMSRRRTVFFLALAFSPRATAACIDEISACTSLRRASVSSSSSARVGVCAASSSRDGTVSLMAWMGTEATSR